MPDTSNVPGKIAFTCKGHKNVLAEHKNTFEFTKDDELTENGDCILGVSCDFNPKELQKFAKNHSFFTLSIGCSGEKDLIFAETNKNFKDSHEIVIRLGGFISDRTFGINADKSAKMLNRKLVEKMKNPNSVMRITLSSENKCKENSLKPQSLETKFP